MQSGSTGLQCSRAVSSTSRCLGKAFQEKPQQVPPCPLQKYEVLGNLTETGLGRVSMRFQLIFTCVLCSLEVLRDRVETSPRPVSGGSRCVVMQFLRMFCELSKFFETAVTRDFYNTKGGSRSPVRPLAELLRGWTLEF